MLSAAYDGDGLRAWKADGSGTKTFFVYDGDQPVVEEDAQGNVTAANGFGADGLRSRYYPGNLVSDYYTYDPQGSLVQRVRLIPGVSPLSPQPGASDHFVGVLDTASFDAFGARHGDIDTATGGPEEFADPVGFGGQWGYRTDPETGLQLMTNRYYDAGVGRFLTRDPIGYKGGVNLYGFVGNNPVNLTDPSGLSPDLMSGVDALGVDLTVGLARPYMNRIGKFLANHLNYIATGWAVSGMIQNPGLGVERTIPHGFENEEKYKTFANNMTDGLRKAGYGDTEPFFQGSSVTGVKYTTGEPFDVGRVSDFDIALANPGLLQKAKGLGIRLRRGGLNTGPLRAKDLKKLGLKDLNRQLSQEAGRPVNFMIFKNATAATQKAPSIPVWPGRTE